MSGHKNKFRSSENSQSNDVNENKEANNNETKETVKETKKVSNVNSSDVEEDTGKIFNLGNGGPASDKAATNKKVITDPVQAWGKPR